MNKKKIFSKEFSNIIFVCELKQSFQRNIESLWRCTKKGTLFGFYSSSGLREITNNLYNRMINDYKIL